MSPPPADDPEPDDPVDAAILRWLERVRGGEPIDLDELTRGLNAAEAVEFHARRVRIEAADGILAGFTLPADGPEPTGRESRYVDLVRHAEGGMGVVYRAWDVELRRTVAYKVMKASCGEPDRFEREAEVTAKLQSPGVVPVYGRVQDGSGRPAYAMEFVAGPTLTKEVARFHDDFPAPRAGRRESAGRREARDGLIRHMEAACRIVDHAHAFDPPHAHCDLKPGNIMIDARGATRVLDWGLARPVADGSSPGGWSGTPGYIAPGLLAGGPLTTACDVYSLGATLAAILCGILPQGSPDLARLDAADTPRPLRAIALAAMADLPEPRYPTAAPLADDLRRYLAGDRVSVDPEPIVERGWRVLSRHKTAAVAGLLSIAVVMVALASLAWGFRRTAHEATVQAARNASRRGNWTSALPLYRRAIDDGGEDALGLRVERLFGFFAAPDRDALEAELAALGRRSDLGRLAAHVDLVRGSLLLCDTATQREGREAIARALRSRDDLERVSSPADIPFAEALADTRPRHVVERLREAVRLDPLHLPAHGSLLVALLATGELAEARRHADQMQGFLPEATLPAFVRAMTYVIEGDKAEAGRHLDALATLIDPDKADDMKALRDYCENFSEVLDRFDRYQVLGKGMGYLERARLFLGVNRLRTETFTALRPFTFPTPTIGLCFESVRSLLDANRLAKDGTEEGYRRLLAMADDSPEALLATLTAVNRLTSGMAKFNNDDIAGSRTDFAEVARLGERAANSPTLVPRSPIRYQSLVLCAIADLLLLKLDPGPDPEHLSRIRDQRRRLVVDGRRWPGEREHGLDILFTMLIAPPTRSQAVDWAPDTREGRQALHDRRLLLFGQGQILVEDWLADEPGNKAALRWRDALKTEIHTPDFFEPESKPSKK